LFENIIITEILKPHKIYSQTALNAGKLSQRLSPQIVGGAEAYLGQFPWQVFISIDINKLCGGSLILTNWILTAAHCTG